MPLYDFRCPHENCPTVARDVYARIADCDQIFDWCPRHGYVEMPQEMTPPAVDDWGNCGQGRFFEHVTKEGMHFRDKASFKRYMREHGLREHHSYVD